MYERQLPLSLQLRDDLTFGNFIAESNSAVLSQLQSLIAGVGEQFIFLWGKAGSGRSHLLQACCNEATQMGLSSVYLSVAEIHQLSPEFFEGLETINVVCIDDIDDIAGHTDWEEALFHLYNRIRDAGSRLVIAGNVAPTRLPIQLPDLVSRLAWGLVYQINELSDEGKVLALQMRAKERGFNLPVEVGNFLINRCARDMKALSNILDKLDTASLSAQRKITIPFVKIALDV